ncbi:WAT1-related protein [Rhynchospora pubera]|uniref:WAT1-related protein n=1 Tax=Rhynchospora pubera TaxID=906938 RepID=A0AAV8HJL4_9POAL|nr:WAT1-related protein [Rhynchospora pubera]
MVFVQLGLAGLTILGDLALNDGMTPFTFVVYRHLIAALLIIPFALSRERIERVNWRESSSKLKILGAVISVAGALLMALYKGQCLVRGISVGNVYHRGPTKFNSVSGFFLLIGSFYSWSAYMILQTLVLKDYPFELTVAGLTCVSGTVLGIVAEIIFEHNVSAWKLHLGWKLYAIIYAGVFISGMSFCIQGYVTMEKGPVFVTAFSPLSMIVVSIFGIFFLEEDLLVGRLIGAIVITLGLYMVIWGKRGDNRRVNRVTPQEVVLPQIPIVLPKKDNVLLYCHTMPMDP